MDAPLPWCRPRWTARCATGWARAEPGVRLENRAAVRIGRGTRLLRGATLLADGGPVTIGAGSLVARWAVVQAAGGRISVGDRSSVGDFANLYGQGGLTVGDDVLIASGVRLLTAEHALDRRDVPIHAQPERVAPTRIEDGAWLGANVVVLAGVTVGAGAVCAAGAVVRHDVEPWAIVGGVPARTIGHRA